MPSKILHGDCLELLPTLETNSIDAILTDPPYNLDTTRRRFGGPNAKPSPTRMGKRLCRGFMNKMWDNEIAYSTEVWAECLRVCKPGAHIAVFGAPRTHHRVWTAIEQAGFEIRDTLMWVTSQGFPKNLDIAKSIQSLQRKGNARFDNSDPNTFDEINERNLPGSMWKDCATGHWTGTQGTITDADALKWQGYGSHLKPAYEPICLARKPIEGTIARNVLKWGTGGLNIDASRIAPTGESLAGGVTTSGRPTLHQEQNQGWDRPWMHDAEITERKTQEALAKTRYAEEHGRWPANVILDDELEEPWKKYFYCAKANKHDRAGSGHPTVKPQAVLRWLAQLICPANGTILDMFAGSGSTGTAACILGMDSILIERDDQYVKDIEHRMFGFIST